MDAPRYHGIIPPLVSPLRRRDELDVPGLERLLEHVLAGGVNGLFILGTTGEGPSLSYRLRREFIGRVCRQVNRRVPVLVAVTDTAFVESVNLAGHAAEAGASAVVLAPPYYLPEGQPELREYLNHIVPELALPLFLYNMPALTKVSIELDTIRWAIDNPRIIGFKDSSADLDYYRSVVELAKGRSDWSVLIGPEELLSEGIRVGGHGGVNGGANIFPRLYVSLYDAVRANNSARAVELHSRVMRVSESLYHIGRHPSAVIKGIKCALSVLGICDDFMAEPFHRFRAEERTAVETRVKQLLQIIE